MNLGANYKGDKKCEFLVWAPLAREVSVKIKTTPERLIPMEMDSLGYWKATANDLDPGTLYFYNIDGEKDRPDPASNHQPNGVHDASQVIDHDSFHWEDDDWHGMRLSEMIMYEIHVGTFTEEGNFDAVISQLDYLREIGINAIEIMPVAQFPGDRNWGYDGVHLYATQNSYGGPESLKRLVNACHRKGMSVILDVVYNHLGPEGNYLWDYGPYFTDHYKTPWGHAINYDGPYSNEVRRFFIENALYWFRDFHIDALRLDAIHGIYDMSAKPFLLELASATERFSNRQGRNYYLIAESDLNNPLIVKPDSKGGYNLHALWCDDFHHSVHVLLTGETDGYYIDFGKTDHLTKSLKEGYVFTGQYSEYRKRNHGNSSADLPSYHFVVFVQNHDQIGNRMKGERLSSLVSFESLKIAAGIVIFSPYIPLLFMGEEYGETAPFLYFISHSDPDLIEGVREGRKREFQSFKWHEDPPDPQSPHTFMKSKLRRNERTDDSNVILRNLYRELIRLRKVTPSLFNLDKRYTSVWNIRDKGLIFIRRWNNNDQSLTVFNFNKKETKIDDLSDFMGWKLMLDSSDTIWLGPGTLLPEKIEKGEYTMRAESFALYASDRN